jgi:hypothetical protein
MLPMTTWVWWERLRPQTRRWLIAHNGEPLPPAIRVEISTAAGGYTSGIFAPDADEHSVLDDVVVDWIEAVANREVDGDS